MKKMASGRYKFPKFSCFTFLLVLKTSYVLFDKLLVEVHCFKGKMSVGGGGSRGAKPKAYGPSRSGVGCI